MRFLLGQAAAAINRPSSLAFLSQGMFSLGRVAGFFPAAISLCLAQPRRRSNDRYNHYLILTKF
jgi:hypothetical protein